MIIDLSRPLKDGMPVYPGDEPTRLSRIRTPKKDGYTAYWLRTGLHAGTHLDAPLHMEKDGALMDSLALSRFIAPGVVLHSCQSLPDRDIPIGSAVLLETGMDALYGTPAYYAHHPAVSLELCRYLISRRIALLGVDAPSPDHPPFPVHHALLQAGIPILENLTGLSALGDQPFTLIALPLPLHAEASPVRAVAVMGAPGGFPAPELP